jgi:hypothetical protein
MLTREQFTDKVKEMAESLGYSYELDHDKSYDMHYAYLTSGEQKVTLVSGEYGHKDRIVISGSYPRAKDNQYPYSVDYCKITVADTKTPFQILQDMLRRFFPKYEEQLAKVLQQNLDRNAYIDRNRAIMESISEATESGVRWKSNGLAGEGMIYPKDIGVYSIESYSDRVKIILEAMEVDEALALIAFLKEPKAAELGTGEQLLLV